MRARGKRIGSVSICSFRPFPLAVLREALRHARRVVVLEKCLAVGLGGIVSDGVRKSLSGIHLNGYTVIAGLGGRAITRASLTRLFEDAERDELQPVTFLDLNADIVNHELERERGQRRTGPTAEAILRRIGTVASGIG
jgi:pyruvate ferredoxin oxidoreductase alpha subunit